MTHPQDHNSTPICALLTDRQLFKISGAERLTFLQGLLTQNIETLTTGAICYTALLTPQGKLIVDFFVINATDHLLIDCPDIAADTLRQKLTFYKLRADVVIENVTDAYTLYASWGDTALSDALEDPRLSVLGRRHYIGEADDAAMPEATAPLAAYHQHLHAHGVPQFGRDMGTHNGVACGLGDVFPLDINLDALNGIDFQKGCFIGQEVTSRMKRKGAIRKRLYQVRFSDPAPVTGTRILADKTPIGSIASSIDNQALALIRTDRLQAAATITSEQGAAVTALTPPDYLSE